MPEQQTDSQQGGSVDSGFSPGIAATQSLRSMEGPPAEFDHEPELEREHGVDRSDRTDDEVANLSNDVLDADKEPAVAKEEGAEEADPLSKLELSDKWIKENPDLYEKIRAAIAQPAKPAEEQVDVSKLLLDRFAELEKPAAEVKQEAAAEVKPPATAAERVKFNDIGDSWNSIDEAYKARSDADLAGEHAKVAEIDNALFDRRVWNMLPGLDARVARMIQATVKQLVPEPVLQEASRSRDYRIDTEGRESAERFLSENLGKAFTEMLRNDDGPDVVIGGRAMDPNIYNRIVAEYPHIGEIQKSHKDPVVSREMTWAARYAAAYKIHQLKQAQAQDLSKAAKTLAAASAKSATRTERDRTRTAVHAGGRSNGQLEGSRKQSTVEDDGELIQHIRDNTPGAATRRLRNL